jgi:hypothetical protein
MAASYANAVKAKKIGRPTTYTDAIANEICELLSAGNSLVRICKLPHMPESRTVYQWLAAPAHEAFALNYTRARAEMTHHLAEQTLEIADLSKDPVKARLQVDARKWFASKMLPKVYGDASQVRLADANGDKLDTAPLISELMALMNAPAKSE